MTKLYTRLDGALAVFDYDSVDVKEGIKQLRRDLPYNHRAAVLYIVPHKPEQLELDLKPKQ